MRGGLLLVGLVALNACGGGSPLAPSSSTPSSPLPAYETWIISGQSNAVGCAVGSGPAPVDRVQAWGASLMPAADPLPFVDPYPNCHVGPWVWAAQAVNRPVRLTGWARQGEPISAWATDGPQWLRLRDAIHAHGQGASYFLWWQGETDAVRQIPGYADALRNLVARVRQASNASPRLVVIGLAEPVYAYEQAGYAMIRAEQRAVAASEDGIYIEATGLPMQGYHLTADGYRQLAERVVAALQ